MSFFSFYPPSGGGSASNISIGTNGDVAPLSSTQVAGQNPSGDLQPLQTDADGKLLVNIGDGLANPLPVSDAAAEASLASLDSKTVAVNTGAVVVASSALPSGASTAALQTSGNASLASVLANQTNGTQTTQISGTVPLPTGAATAANQTSQITQETAIAGSVASIDTKTPALGQALAAASVPVVLTAAQLSTLTPLTSVAVTGTVTANAGTNLNTSALNLEATQSAMSAKLPATLGQKASAASMAVVLASDQSSIPVAATLSAETTKVIGTVNISANQTVTSSEVTSTTSSITSVAGSATTVSLLASNSSRKNAAFYNDSTAILYLKLGATASTTSYTVQIGAGGYYELPVGKIYTGAIDGIWASATGAVRITELS